MMKNAATEDRASIPAIVLLYWPSSRNIFNGIRSWLSVLEGHGSILSQPCAYEIRFLDWQALEAFASSSQDTLSVIETFSWGALSVEIAPR